MARAMLGTNWLLVLGAFMVVSWLATRFAFSSASLATQYAALFAYVVAESIIFVPLLFVANHYAPGAIQSAALITLVGFTGLTAIAYISKSDFQFLGALLKWAGLVALLAIVGGVVFGFQLGTWFSVAMIGLAGGAILYDTKTILRVFPEDRYVGASLKLFASVALMFWYALRLIMGSRR
jgi:FtsH-binding integral membrane protein